MFFPNDPDQPLQEWNVIMPIDRMVTVRAHFVEIGIGGSKTFWQWRYGDGTVYREMVASAPADHGVYCADNVVKPEKETTP